MINRPCWLHSLECILVFSVYLRAEEMIFWWQFVHTYHFPGGSLRLLRVILTNSNLSGGSGSIGLTHWKCFVVVPLIFILGRPDSFLLVFSPGSRYLCIMNWIHRKSLIFWLFFEIIDNSPWNCGKFDLFAKKNIKIKCSHFDHFLTIFSGTVPQQQKIKKKKTWNAFRNVSK